MNKTMPSYWKTVFIILFVATSSFSFAAGSAPAQPAGQYLGAPVLLKAEVKTPARPKNAAPVPTGVWLIASSNTPWKCAPGTYSFEIPVPNQSNRTFTLFIPSKYSSSSVYPLVFFCHGGGGTGQNAMNHYGWQTVAEREGFIMVYPDGSTDGQSKRTWNAGHGCGYAWEKRIDDIGFLSFLIGAIKQMVKIDSSRIYCAGFSNGAMMTHYLGSMIPGILAAISTCAGSIGGQAIPQASYWSIPTPKCPLPVIDFHGKLDDEVSYFGGKHTNTIDPNRSDSNVNDAIAFWVKVNGCSHIPKCVVSGSSNIITDTYSNANDSAAVVLYTIENQAHAYPGSTLGAMGADSAATPTQEISAAELSWSFFKAHKKK
ncbi:MAG: hypothetical protein HQM09_16245 [Candidatus Riflebacteria bacterium]|nr:hypothetical protein [Candidatus Riflebacteria bacterium]